MAVTAKELPLPSAVRTTRPLTFIERLTPTWGRKAARWVEDEARASGAWFVVCALMALIIIGIGFAMLFGDGYATIQGIRYLLLALGVSVQVNNMPPAPWWGIQVVLVFVQVFAKVIPGLRPLWTPSYIFNALTTGFFVAIALAGLVGVSLGAADGMTPSVGTVAVGIVGAVVGHFLALGAEQVTLTGFCMAGSLFTALFRPKR